MFSRSNSTKQSFSKSLSKHGRSNSSFSRDSGVSKRRHEHRRRASTAVSATTVESTPSTTSR